LTRCKISLVIERNGAKYEFHSEQPPEPAPAAINTPASEELTGSAASITTGSAAPMASGGATSMASGSATATKDTGDAELTGRNEISNQSPKKLLRKRKLFPMTKQTSSKKVKPQSTKFKPLLVENIPGKKTNELPPRERESPESVLCAR